MRMSKGWVPLYREDFEKYFDKSPFEFHFYIWLLMNAYHEAEEKWIDNKTKIDLSRGDVLTSVRDATRKTGLHHRTLRKVCENLKTKGLILIKSKEPFIITLCHFDHAIEIKGRVRTKAMRVKNDTRQPPLESIGCVKSDTPDAPEIDPSSLLLNNIYITDNSCNSSKNKNNKENKNIIYTPDTETRPVTLLQKIYGTDYQSASPSSPVPPEQSTAPKGTAGAVEELNLSQGGKPRKRISPREAAKASPEADKELGVRWYRWAGENFPGSKFNDSEFILAIGKLRDRLGSIERVVDVFLFISQVDPPQSGTTKRGDWPGWGAVVRSPCGLVERGFKKLDSILASMSAPRFRKELDRIRSGGWGNADLQRKIEERAAQGLPINDLLVDWG